MTACLFFSMLMEPAFADDGNILQGRLNQVNSFHAIFIHRLTGAEGSVLQEGKGELWIKRSNLFNWHMTTPDESVLVSDGKTLWFYNPLLEQATANWLKNMTANTPLMLIIRNSPADWHEYNVQQHGDTFLLVPKFYNSNLRRFTIKVTANGIIKGFTATEQNGQQNDYELNIQKTGPIEATKFHFTLPKGVLLDDQRH